MIETDFLKTITETPSVGTACGPMVSLLTIRFGPDYSRTLVSDGFCLFQKAGARLEQLEVIFVAHLDEIGGCIYGPRPEGGFLARHWGNRAGIFAHETLQGFDYLEEDAERTFPVEAKIVVINDENRLVFYGGEIRPYRTVWTFRQQTTIEGDVIEGKALDPRVTTYAVEEAVRAMDDSRVGALFVMAEECAMDVAQKAVVFLQRHAPELRLVVNADVPSIENIGEGNLEMPAIRIFEGRNFIDPAFGIRTADLLAAKKVEFHLSAARSGSQTIFFTPLAPTLSVALPSKGVHMPRVKMSLRGTQRCITLLQAIGEHALEQHRSRA